MGAISQLILKKNWHLISFPERYGEGVWVVLGPVLNHLYEVREIKDGSDIESLKLGEYLQNEGAWLPTAFANDFESAIQLLEEKVTRYCDDEEWHDAVYVAFESVMEVSDNSYGLTAAVEAKTPSLFYESAEV